MKPKPPSDAEQIHTIATVDDRMTKRLAHKHRCAPQSDADRAAWLKEVATTLADGWDKKRGIRQLYVGRVLCGALEDAAEALGRGDRKAARASILEAFGFSGSGRPPKVDANEVVAYIAELKSSHKPCSDAAAFKDAKEKFGISEGAAKKHWEGFQNSIKEQE